MAFDFFFDPGDILRRFAEIKLRSVGGKINLMPLLLVLELW
jgi:hypothetical protein